jgi:hypothetical protein
MALFQRVEAGPSAAETCPADDVPAADPAWPLRAHVPGRATPRNLRPEPIPPLDLRIDSNVPASPHRAGPSSPGRQPSLAPVLALPPRT